MVSCRFKLQVSDLICWFLGINIKMTHICKYRLGLFFLYGNIFNKREFLALPDMKIYEYIAPLLWFLLTNIGVYLLLSINLLLFGLDESLAGQGVGLLDIGLAVLSISTVGALGLILGSKIILRFYLGARIVNDATDTKLQQLKIIVACQAGLAGIRTPVLAIYDSQEMNAFAIGTGRHDATLVLSQPLLDALTLDELSAVIGHEITHITNGDMLTLLLMQGVVNMCVHFPAHLLGTGLDRLLVGQHHFGPIYKMISLFLQLSFGGIASLIVMWFSRQREFRADAGGVVLAGHPEMLAALRSLQAGNRNEVGIHPFAIFGLNSSFQDSGFWRLFTSHPSLTERIRALS